MNLNDLFCNVYQFPGAHSQMQSPLYQQQQAGLADAMRDYQPVPVPSPAEIKEGEEQRKNRENYARWLARMARDPLADVTFK